ncbi:TetR/AcrR family transcriptional regulator [Goodfellowiella coeruleoviolacea]|uniref:Transcriptional regulator, TetR family n=1 Tax=Goodfellowiella coeruleoviolacea TaxID=334858 RepID=A0AAE3G9Y3_9PSEU|nr:TetR/AcrR family transcriptional regulator [Goodfellowiella coeruleoviolacea]MCP2163452.1 transcriptional regulator, TetR family [Goodfellowiella coeruleoviolacea]
MSGEDELGLRERKKLQTWRTIRAAALRLFNERGFEAVSVDDVAAAANVSRSTLFNYFSSKEALVFDPDPQETQAWRELMRDRPADEPLWTSLQEILIGYLSLMADRMAIQKRLKATSPTLAQSAHDSADRFNAELSDWVAARTPEARRVRATLLVNSARAVLVTAYAAWSPDEGFDRFLRLVRDCFAQAGRGFAADQS